MNDPDYRAFDNPEMAKLPFSEAVRHGQTLYLSGQIGTGAGGDLVSGGIKAEARQMMKNIAAALARNGSSMDRIIKCTVFLADMSEWQAFNEVYVSFFKAGRLPARSALGASGLALDARVEMECIAAVGT